MSVSVSMPQLGESVTEGTVTRWLKREGEHVQADEPLLEVSTDKVDTEIPSPVSGVLRGITVAEDETVAVGAELAVIDEEGSSDGTAEPPAAAAADAEAPATAPDAQAGDGQGSDGQGSDGQAAAAAADGAQAPAAAAYQPPYQQQGYQPPYQQQQQPAYEPPYQQPPADQPPAAPPAPPQPAAQPPQSAAPPAAPQQPGYQQPAAQQPAAQQPAAQPAEDQQPAAQPAEDQPGPDRATADGAAQRPQDDAAQPAAGPPVTEEPAQPAADEPAQDSVDSPYVTPLVRKLAAEHGISLAEVAGTGVGGRIRKQDVLDAARELRGSAGEPAGSAAQPAPQAAQAPAAGQQPARPAGPAPAAATAAAVIPAAVAAPAPQESARPPIVPSSLRGTTERMSRARQVIAQRMVESLQTSAQLTTVVEADVTAIARLRDRAKAGFEAREGVKLSFLPFFALAVVEALKVHPKLNAVIDTASAEVTYHDAEHLGIAVDTERGLMVPVIRGAGDLNIAGLARKIADLAQRTRAGRVSPDDLSGGTFTLTNTGSRGALFDTPIINQPQVGILGTGTVVKRAVVVDDPALGEVITVRSMVYLALTYDHRLVDGADAVRFLVTMKARLEEGAFETELGL
jgi:2-oxoglutarate dehydrogenase E2 component (dihydrolipoamide succinyltransferase)